MWTVGDRAARQHAIDGGIWIPLWRRDTCKQGIWLGWHLWLPGVVTCFQICQLQEFRSVISQWLCTSQFNYTPTLKSVTISDPNLSKCVSWVITLGFCDTVQGLRGVGDYLPPVMWLVWSPFGRKREHTGRLRSKRKYVDWKHLRVLVIAPMRELKWIKVKRVPWRWLMLGWRADKCCQDYWNKFAYKNTGEGGCLFIHNLAQREPEKPAESSRECTSY